MILCRMPYDKNLHDTPMVDESTPGTFVEYPSFEQPCTGFFVRYVVHTVVFSRRKHNTFTEVP